MKYLKLREHFRQLLSFTWFQIILIAFIIQASYLGLSGLVFRIGFPLDDAWIHQTYARNFAQSFRWEFVPGQISGGSTSPLWTLLLVPGYWISGKLYLFWTYFISFMLYSASAILFERTISKITGVKKNFPVFALIFLMEWHLVWAVSSGMETILVIFLYISMIFLLMNQQKFTWKFAIIASLLIWVRPDAITFLGIIGLILIDDIFGQKNKIFYYWKLFSSLIISTSLYGYFNYFLNGSYFPNTFYAKQTEYAILYNTPLITRLLNLAIIPLAGVGVIFLPFFLYQIYLSIRNKNINFIALALWIFGFITLYALRLPVTYQHGRYVIPVIPIFLLFGCLGYISFVSHSKNWWRNIIIKSFNISAAILLIIFLGLGANAYAQDVAIIESEMVSASQWIARNTEKDAIIGAHDIGALGFFSERKIIDLAGLISPDVIPFMDDENKLATYLTDQNVRYLMTFPDWYKELTKTKRLIYSGQAQFVINAGGSHMDVFVWND